MRVNLRRSEYSTSSPLPPFSPVSHLCPPSREVVIETECEISVGRFEIIENCFYLKI